MDETTYSLFRFAPHEMSHSAFWAWILYTLNATNLEPLSGPRRIALRLLNKVGVPTLKVPIEVTPEKPTKAKLPGERGRYDIHVKDSQGTVLVIENKVTAIPSKDQLVRFLNDLGDSGKNGHLALLSTAFDVDVRDSLPREVPYIGPEDLVEIIGPDKDSHQVVRDYALWLNDLLKQRSKLSEEALGDDPKTFQEALKTPEGQWALMESLTVNMSGRQYRGRNLDGSPWTQFRFVEENKARDALFYRIDNLKDGAYLSVRQYQTRPFPAIRAKRQRLMRLRNLWSEAVTDSGKRLTPSTPRDRGEKESEISYFLLANNPPRTLCQNLPVVHQTFLRKLAKT